MKETEERLHNDYDKRFVKDIMQRLEALADDIDHNHNLESLVIFVNETMAEYARLPIPVENRVIIDATFATRDLVRALNEQAQYYVLVLSRENARLIEAFNDKVVKEFAGDFPVKNDTLYTTDKLKMTMSSGQENLIEEFFNRVDKIMQKHRKKRSLPVILVCEERNYHHYLKVTDKNMVIGHLERNRDDEKALHIVDAAWPIVKEHVKQKNDTRVAELKKAVSSQTFLSDIDDIWRAVNEGRGKTVFVQQGYFQPAVIEGNSIQLVKNHAAHEKGVVDDIIDEIIEINRNYGGDTVFLSNGELKEFQGLALITRY